MLWMFLMRRLNELVEEAFIESFYWAMDLDG